MRDFPPTICSFISASVTLMMVPTPDRIKRPLTYSLQSLNFWVTLDTSKRLTLWKTLRLSIIDIGKLMSYEYSPSSVTYWLAYVNLMDWLAAG